MSVTEILRRERECKRAKQEERERKRERQARRVLRLHAVKAKTGLGKSQIYQGMQDGTFPRSVSISARARGWIEDELDDWLDGLIAERDAAERLTA